MSRSRKRGLAAIQNSCCFICAACMPENIVGNSSARIRSANRTGSSGAVASWVISARSRLAAGESSATFSMLAAFAPAAPRPWGPTSGSSARVSAPSFAARRPARSPARSPTRPRRRPSRPRSSPKAPWPARTFGDAASPETCARYTWGMMPSPRAMQNCASNAESTALKGTSSKVASWVCRYVSTSFMTALWDTAAPRTAASPTRHGAVAKAASRHHDLSTYLPLQ